MTEQPSLKNVKVSVAQSPDQYKFPQMKSISLKKKEQHISEPAAGLKIL
jgi:hypothetical protein